MTTSPSSPIWSPQKQERWAATQRGDPALLHILLDASGSMDGYQDALRRSYNLYLHTLQRAAHPLTVLDTRSFGTTLQAPAPQALGAAPDLTHATYTASYGGTALYDAIGTVGSTAAQDGQHILVVFTDGQDNASQHYTAAALCELLTALQEHGHWLAVFLGAFEAALAVAVQCGFKPGNTLTFPNEAIPEAFTVLMRATQTYLKAGAEARKLLAEKGIFHGHQNDPHP